METFTRAGKLDQALQVKKELASLDSAALAKSDLEVATKDTTAGGPPVTTIEDTTWVARTGFIERIEFHSSGAMTVTSRIKKVYTGWTYNHAQDGSVLITPTGSPNPKLATFIFTNQGATLEGVFDGKQTFKLNTEKR